MRNILLHLMIALTFFGGINAGFASVMDDADDAFETGNAKLANQLYESEAKKGNPFAMEKLADNFSGSNNIYGKASNQQLADDLHKQALAKFKSLAAGGDPKAQAKLGFIYSNKFFSKRYSLNEDKEEPNKWYKKSAENYLKAAKKGDGSAMVALAEQYRRGLGVEQNSGTASKLYQSAISLDYTPAKYEFGYWLTNNPSGSSRFNGQDFGNSWAFL